MGAKVSSSVDLYSLWCFTSLEYCGWRERWNLLLVSKKLFSLTYGDEFWKWMCCRLSEENGVYYPKHSRSYRVLFKELYPLHNMWDFFPHQEGVIHTLSLTSTTKSSSKNRMQVFARFKPKSKSLSTTVNDTSPNVDENDLLINGTNEEENMNNHQNSDDIEVTLPLHQRLAMIRMSHKLNSNQDALRILTSEGGWFQSRWSDITNKLHNKIEVSEGNTDAEGEKENIQGMRNSTTSKSSSFVADENYVILSSKQQLNLSKNDKNYLPMNFSIKNDSNTTKVIASVQSINSTTGKVVMLAPDVGLREFSFNGVFNEEVSEIFDDTIMPLFSVF